MLAGGGGGSGGGHSTSTDGFGGDAGLPTAAGQTAAGSPGTDGYEGQTAALEPIIVGGGQGGTQTGGAGGTHSTDPSLSGLPGSDRAGGAGAPDPNYDAGGGGGLAGGGGGASTVIKNSDPDASGTVRNTVAGGGGGGGSSFVAGSATDVTATAVGRATGTGTGAAGSIVLDWIECSYDLAVTKTVAVEGGAAATTGSATTGDMLTWTVTVTNNGHQAMTRGDVLTLRDTLPGAAPTTLVSVTTAGGSNDAAPAARALREAAAIVTHGGSATGWILLSPEERTAVRDLAAELADPDVDALLDRTGSVPVVVPDARDAVDLTERELVVLAALADDTNLAEVAARLHVSLNTVKSQLRSTYRKLGVGRRADALARARELGLL